MSEETTNTLKIFIIGAGCSVDYGYPLSKDFLGCLRNYAKKVAGRPKCDRLRQIVTETADLMESSRTPTIDRMVRWIDEQPGKLGAQSIFCDHPDNKNYKDKIAWAGKTVLDAKRVTMVDFLEREEGVRESALCGYRDFLHDVFGERRDLGSLLTTNSRVLSFNYDRLFEMAFCSYFKLQQDCYVNAYGKELLNSGWNGAGGRGEKIVPDRFCFLKLHGSAAAWILGSHGKPLYFSSAALRDPDNCINDDFFWPPGRKLSPFGQENAEPFIVFPHEKEGVRQSGHIPICKEYLDAIWRKAEELIGSASQVWVIGYSFDANDRMSLMGLLRRKAQDCQIFVQNPCADDICNELRLKYPDLAGSFVPIPKRFGHIVGSPIAANINR